VAIAPIGPLTNIALLLRLHPHLVSKITHVCLMGGSIGEGNTTASAEFNILADPEAADVVFRSGPVELEFEVAVTWTGGGEVATSLPARAIANFFGDSFERRTNHPLKAVTGDAQLAALISLDAARPHLFLGAAPQRTPWISLAKFNETGGVVVWRAADTVGSPPPDIAQRFPGLVPEVPRAFERMVTGRQPLLRIGWAIVRPQTP